MGSQLFPGDSIQVDDSPPSNPAVSTSPTASVPGSSSSAAQHHGSNVSNNGDGQTIGGASGKSRRAFKACAHCRQRKAKCELGDIDNPRDPPCTRCRRESVECTFLPSRRGGRIPFSSQQKKAGQDVKPHRKQQPLHAPRPPVLPTKREYSPSADFREAKSGDPSPSENPKSQVNSRDANLSFSTSYPIIFPSSIHYGSLPTGAPSNSDLFQAPSLHTAATALSPSATALDASPQDHSSVSDTGSINLIYNNLNNPLIHNSASEAFPPANQYPSRKKRRRHSAGVVVGGERSGGGLVDPETLASAPMRNPVDALDLLVLAADGGGVGQRGDELINDDEANGGGGRRGEEGDEMEEKMGEETEERPGVIATLDDFPLVKMRVLDKDRMMSLVDLFFSHIHFIFPIIPSAKVPRTEAELAIFARDELHLSTVIIVISSRHDKDPLVHEGSWAYLQTLINALIMGKPASVGAVEGLLLLSEYLPRQQDSEPTKINAEENRMSWMMVGTAVRLGYMLRLDEKSLLPAQDSEDTSNAQALLNRERVAWTYCYLFDRQISIRTGKAFWSRGPALCFTVPNAAKNFPSLRYIPDVQDDFASLLQAYVELSQIMTSTNDILYPSKERTLALVRMGEYYKHLDQFLRSLEAFKITWEGKRWATYPLTECIWITYHYLRLYIYGFAFQAHIQRATWDQHSLDNTRRGSPSAGIVFFPAGLVASPDAKFILEAIDAAADLLRLVTDRLHPGGALPFLPWRFFMMFSYAGVFLLKAVFVEAVVTADRTVIIRLLKRLIFVLACASTDEQHPGVRYARLLNGLLRAFSQGHESMSATRAPTPSRRNSLSGEASRATMASGSGDLDFTLPWPPNGSESRASPFPSHNVQQDGTHSNEFHPFAAAASSPAFPPHAHYDFAPPGMVQSRSASASVHAGNTTNGGAFPMLPFSESQPFHQLASTLEDVDFSDFGFEAEALPEPSEAINFLLQDDGLDVLWGSFDATGGDWINPGGGGFGSY